MLTRAPNLDLAELVPAPLRTAMIDKVDEEGQLLNEDAAGALALDVGQARLLAHRASGDHELVRAAAAEVALDGHLPGLEEVLVV